MSPHFSIYPHMADNCKMGSCDCQSKIVFFDLETTIPIPPGQAYAILEFGSILLCPKKLFELDSYVTLVRPLDLSLISAKSIEYNGITADDVMSYPTFSGIADKVYDILHGKVWAGHNIRMFDCVRLKEAYARINKPPPVPKRIIDTLTLLSRFEESAGNMKMATLAAYFGLGKQIHRSLPDIRMNIEVVKLCASVLFLESSQEATENNRASMTTRLTLPPNLPNRIEYGYTRPDALHPSPSTTAVSTTCSNHADQFINPELVLMAAITITIAPFLNGPNKIQILHRDIPMQIHCHGMRIRFGLSTQFVDHAGNPRLSFVVDANSSYLLNILDACDDIVKRFFHSDGNSQWTPVVCRKPGFYDSPTIRLHLPTATEDTSRWITEIYYKNSSSIACTPQLVSSRYADVAEVESLFRPGSLVDAYFSLDPYSYQQNVGIRLVAKKLVIHTS